MAKTKFYCKLILLLLVSSIYSYGQGYFSYDYISASKLKDELGNRYGSGDMQVWSGGYMIPLSMRNNERGQMTAWSANINIAYALLDNKGDAKSLNPDNMLNGSISLMNIRPIGKRWSMMAVLGGGVYASTSEISTKSILANGGVVFIYRLNKNVDLGIGAGVTNSYGVPMAMPMLYFSWKQSGKYNFKIDMSSGLKISASTQFNKWMRLDLVAIEMDGMSAVMNVDGKSKIHSTVMMKSYISPSFTINEHMAFYMGIGGNWVRGISITDRSLKGFFNSFKESNDPYYGVALRLSAGVRYKF